MACFFCFAFSDVPVEAPSEETVVNDLLEIFRQEDMDVALDKYFESLPKSFYYNFDYYDCIDHIDNDYTLNITDLADMVTCAFLPSVILCYQAYVLIDDADNNYELALSISLGDYDSIYKIVEKYKRRAKPNESSR